MSFKKIDKEFCITDNSVNCYGYRLLTEGFLLNRFNPSIGYFMHDRDKGVAVRWSDFRIDGDKVYAKPTINILAFPDLANQIENGFYQSASVGHIIALEWTEDASKKLDEQTGITVTKWFCRECSIVDVPGNYNAIAELYDKDNNSLKNLISIQSKSLSSGGNIPEQYRKSFIELFVSGDLEHVMNNHPEYYKKVVDEHNAKYNLKKEDTNFRPSPTYQKKEDTSKGLQATIDESSIPEKYQGLSYKDLWISGDLELLKRTHPQYVKKLQEENQKQLEKDTNRGTVKESQTETKKISEHDLSIPERYRGQTMIELYHNGGLEYLKANHPNTYNNLMAN